MIEYLLVLQLCATMDNCAWHTVAKYQTEEQCVASGLTTDPISIRFKCVGIEHKVLLEETLIPLPRPRPTR